jgi:hypothetical protein
MLQGSFLPSFALMKTVESCCKIQYRTIILLFYEKIGMVSGKFHCNKQIRLLLYEFRLHVNYEV